MCPGPLDWTDDAELSGAAACKAEDATSSPETAVGTCVRVRVRAKVRVRVRVG